MRLIDADALYELLDGGYDIDLDELPETKAELLRMIDQEETIDAVPVVRCKDCKHRIPNPHGYTCKRLVKEVNLDHYCAWGERREDASKTD